MCMWARLTRKPDARVMRKQDARVMRPASLGP